jgi:hypothetical protein
LATDVSAPVSAAAFPKNSRWRPCTARSVSASSTTTETFASYAANEMLKDGLVQRSNALALVRAVGLEV